jgi:serine/threonine protein kinase
MIENPSPLEDFQRLLPQSLREHVGPCCRVRCLSSRDFREVYLVEDSQGAWRVFKIARQRDPETLVRFQQVREGLKGLSAEVGLLPVLAYGLEPVHGIAWEELPLADSVDPKSVEFENYSPVTTAVGASSTTTVAAQTALPVVHALGFLHRRGLVHGDVKPANLLQLQGRWVLADYDTVGTVHEAVAITASTEGYCPPGTTEGLERDFYALGKLIYELWSGNTRLEYPSLPPRLRLAGTWSREDRLINRLIEALCNPVGMNRLRQLAVVQTVLEAVESKNAVRLSRAETLLRPRGNRAVKVLAGGLLLGVLIWTVLTQSGWLPRLPLFKAMRALISTGFESEPTKGLAAYFPLDGDAQDHSGQGHHSTPFKVSWVADASKTPARAAHFNGEAGISIPEFPESEAGQHSLVLWMRSSQTNEGKLLIKDRSVGDRDSPGRQWLLGIDNRVAKGGVWALPEGGTNQLCSVLGIMKSGPGYWTHIVQTWDGRRLELWIDGERVDSTTAQGTLAPGDSPVRIGWDQYYFFKGDIDEVRIYDRALSDDEVRGMFRLGLRRAVHQWWAGLSGG